MQMKSLQIPDTPAEGPSIPIVVDPDVEKLLKVSIDNLGKVFKEPLRLGLFSTAAKEKGLFTNAETSELLFTALDSVAFHLKSVDDDPDYHDEYLELFKTVPQPSGLPDWLNKIDEINKAIERSNPKHALKQFRNDRDAYLQDLKDRRSQLQAAFSPSQGVDVKFLGGEFTKKVERGANNDNTAASGGVRAFTGWVKAADDFGGINCGNKAGGN